MEKLVVEFGFGLFCTCFMLAFLVTLPFLFGCLAGMIMIAFGWFFWED